MRRLHSDEHGVALVTVLLFMVLTFILLTSMLTMAGNEMAISGLYRDGVRALEYGHAGLGEGVQRVESGLPYTVQFTGSLDPGITVRALTVDRGPSGAILEIQSDATVLRNVRRLSSLILAVSDLMPPNILFGHNFAEQGNAAEVGSGDVYSQTYIRFTQLPDEDTLAYAGWQVRKDNPGPIPLCYNHQECVNAANTNPQPSQRCTGGNPDARCNWYPGSRRTVYEDSDEGQQILANTNPTTCAVTSDPLPAAAVRAETTSQIPDASPVNRYGFDRDTQIVNLDGSTTTIASQVGDPCGLPYMYLQETFQDETGVNQTRWFKTLIFEQWFQNYWQFDTAALSWGKRGTNPDGTCNTTDPQNLCRYPDFGAVPPFPPFTLLEPSASRDAQHYMTGGGTIAASTTLDFGNCANPNNCDSPASTPSILLLDCDPPGSCNYTINANLTGHGLILVDGNLTINGTFNYWGTMIVNGNLTLGSGNVTVWGGLVAKSTAYITGNITVNAGGMVANILAGPTTVTKRSWWER